MVIPAGVTTVGGLLVECNYAGGDSCDSKATSDIRTGCKRKRSLLFIGSKRPALPARKTHPILPIVINGASNLGIVSGAIVLLLAASGFGMDRVRVEARIDDAVAKYGVTGTNVLVAILDRGLDWQHPDFRHPDGTTRIEAIFDMLDNTGAKAPGNPYGVGTIYTQAQINQALAAGTNLAIRDAVGHGTTTTGIAAGGGRGLARYRGVAPEARLVVVKCVSDGAPAHDAEPAEAAYPNVKALFTNAVDFVTAKAAELHLPCVMLLNSGSVGGPTDGTSALSRKIDATVGPGKPGFAFVTGSSDDGGAANRISGVVAQDQVVTIQIQKEEAGVLQCDLWYPETDRFNVRVITPNGTFGPYAAPRTAAASDVRTTADFLYYHLGRDVDFDGAANQKRELWLRFTGPSGLYQVELTGATITSGRFDGTLNPSRFETGGGPLNRFLNFIAPGSIYDLAASSNNICPNSYLWRTNWIDIDNVARTIPNQGVIGDLWNGSGVGPTFDGRLGVDLSAPGDSLITTYAPKSYFGTFRFNLVQNGGANYGRASAVSAAAPIVTGIVALLLEMDPTLDAGQIKEILHQSARADAFTGAVPNPHWGYGKADALAALDLLHARLTRLEVSGPGTGPLRISARGHNGKTYYFERSTNLVDWTRVQTNTAALLPFSIDVADPTGAGYYRLAR